MTYIYIYTLPIVIIQQPQSPALRTPPVEPARVHSDKAKPLGFLGLIPGIGLSSTHNWGFFWLVSYKEK